MLPLAYNLAREGFVRNSIVNSRELRTSMCALIYCDIYVVNSDVSIIVFVNSNL